MNIVLSVSLSTLYYNYSNNLYTHTYTGIYTYTYIHTHTGHESRRGETIAVTAAMKSLGLTIVEMRDPGHLDGGDVLFTGKEIFVGQSQRTNEVMLYVWITDVCGMI